MFVSPRMKDESVVLGDDIILTVIEVRGDKVRLGVEHPRSAQFTGRRCTRRSAAWSRTSHGDAIDNADRRIVIGTAAPRWASMPDPTPISCRIDLSSTFAHFVVPSNQESLEK